MLCSGARDVRVDQVSLSSPADERLFRAVEAPEGTSIAVCDRSGKNLGNFRQPRTGNIEVSLDRFHAMQRAAAANEEDNLEPSDYTEPKRRQRIDAAYAVLRADPPLAQNQRIEAALTILQDYTPFYTNSKKWTTAIRELITIGKPALPRLIDELDHIDRVARQETELRALGFVLRGIGDARAVPALIRALPYTLQRPLSDYGCTVEDGELLAFMQQHDHAHTREGTRFSLGRPINEILPAFQKLTGVVAILPTEDGGKEFGQIRYIFLQGDANDVCGQRKLFLRFAERWANWWAKNWKQYVSDEKDAQLGQTQAALERIAKQIDAKPDEGKVPEATPQVPAPNANDPAGNTSATKEPTSAGAEQRAKALAEEAEKRHYQALLGKLKAQIIDAQRAGKTETLSATADSFNVSADGRLLYLRVLHVDQYVSKDGVDIPSKTTALIDKRFNAWKVPVPAVRYLMVEGPHISRHSQDYRDWLLVENGRLESGRFADDLAMQAAISEKRPDEWPTGSAEVKAAIALLEQPWQTNVTEEELDKAAEKLKPAADEAVDMIMRAFNRSGQQYAYRHRAVQLLQRLGTPKARVTLLDIALGRTAEDLPAGKAWASVHYLRIAPDTGDARKLLASDDADVLGNALRRLKGVAIDEDLLKRLVELTAYKTKEPHSQWYIRKLAADVMAADPAGSFAARKVEAILAAVRDVANMPDADKVQKLSTGTNAERYYSGYMRGAGGNARRG